MNLCAAFPDVINGGAVCLAQRNISTARCEVKCNWGYDHLTKPNDFEQCGPSTNWTWSYINSGTSVPECIGNYRNHL